ncbi:MAG: 50S ribosomal protein L4 [Clostridia bacterium]|nr:50S ribosomal protein L4 [Clostridia bacterium]
MQTKVLNIKGEEVGKVSLNDEVFKAPYNEALIHQIVVAYLANQRQGTKSTLTRSEVRGGGRKPWRQKGTGNARQGSIRAPQWIKGGVVFAPKPRDFSKKVNKQMKRAAFVSAISTCLAEKCLVVVDDLTLEAPKTKAVAEILSNLKLEKRVTIVTNGMNENVVLSASNIPNVNVTTADQLCTYDIVVSDKILITKEAIKAIEEACK